MDLGGRDNRIWRADAFSEGRLSVVGKDRIEKVGLGAFDGVCAWTERMETSARRNEASNGSRLWPMHGSGGFARGREDSIDDRDSAL